MQPKNKLLESYKHIRSALESNNFNVSDCKEIAYGVQFTVSTLNWSGLIRIYQNKKDVLKIDYSQLNSKANVIKIQTLIESKGIPSGSKNLNKNVGLEFPIIGTDESGKGDFFGPLVSAGVYVDEQSAKKLIECGVKDSKKLSDAKNLELAQKVTKICKGRFAIIEISPEKYNNLYEQLKKEKKNLNTLLAWGHAKAIEEVLSKVDCKVAIADQFADESFILSKLQERGKNLRLIQMHRAEQNIAVAAASILARARFLEKLSKLSNEYKINLSKGVSQTVIESGKKIVATYGEDILRKVAKLHFKTTNDVLNK
ncbi:MULTISPECIES: ribonuclease HIII [unclassified Petrotoga]|uniref:ribonuclease HIII n=1 Tax=unclassified Petrotoga TaxID=2620614 RepID=UPI000EF1709D|nr:MULTISPECIES: ribonuclease HIII [unclassified Petrotoga]